MNGNPESWEAAWLAGAALGLTREDQEAWQRLLQRIGRVAEAQAGLATTWSGILGTAGGALRERVAERTASGNPVASLRELYDLWVDVAESHYGESAAGEAYAHQLAELANALSELRIAQREFVERGARSVDLPTRTELDAVHQRLRDLTLAVRALESRLRPVAPVPEPEPGPRPRSNSMPKSKPAAQPDPAATPNRARESNTARKSKPKSALAAKAHAAAKSNRAAKSNPKSASKPGPTPLTVAASPTRRRRGDRT